MTGDRELTNKQKVFVEEYLQCFNATEAARKAGYQHPNKRGPENVVKRGIAEVIARRLKEKGMSADEVLAHLTDIARFDPGRLLGKAGVIDWDGAKERGDTRYVQKIEWSDGKLKIEFTDRMDALQLLGKAHGLFRDVQEHSGSIRVEYVNDWRRPTGDDG